MPVFNCFFKIIRNNITMLLIYVVIFMVLAIFLAGSGEEQNEVYRETAVPVAVIDRDNSKLSKALTKYLGEHHTLVSLPDSTEALQDALFYRSVEYILFVPEGYEVAFLDSQEDITLENVKLPDSNSGIYLDHQIDRYLSTVRSYLTAEYALGDALDYTAANLEISTTVEISSGSQDEVQASAYYFQFLPYLLMALIISALGPILIAFQKSELLRRIESSSLKLKERNFQIALGCIVSALAIWLFFIAAAFVLYAEEMRTSAAVLRILNSLVFVFVCVSLAFLLGQFLKKTSALGAINNALSLGMSFLCGIFVRQELLGSGVLLIARFLPAYWYIRSNDMLFSLTDVTMADQRIFVEGILMQLGFAAAVFAVALVVGRQKKFHAIA